ncbi:MAG: hypothetical protein ACK55Z_26685, partial [bacterium]
MLGRPPQFFLTLWSSPSRYLPQTQSQVSLLFQRWFPLSSPPSWPWWALLCRPQEGLPELLGVQMLT